MSSGALLVHNSCPEGMVDLYRAVSPEEFHDIMKTRRLNLHPGGMEGKQFGHDLNEVVNLASESGTLLKEAAAVVRIRVPRSTYDALDHTPVDGSTLFSGSSTAYGGALDLLNSTILEIEHAF